MIDTVTSSRVLADGGGVLTSSGTAELRSLTVTRNIADSDDAGAGLGGGLHNGTANTTVANSIVALNRYGNGNIPDCSGLFTSVGITRSRA